MNKKVHTAKQSCRIDDIQKIERERERRKRKKNAREIPEPLKRCEYNVINDDI